MSFSDYGEMLNFELRPLNLPKDYAALANLTNIFNNELHRGLTTAERLMAEESKTPSGDWRERVVAVEETGNVVGYAASWQTATQGNFASILVVHPAFRKQGIGQRLLEHLEDWGRRTGATKLVSEIPDHLQESLTFVEKYEYKINRHMCQSVLDLNSFEIVRFFYIVKDLESSGIHFLSFSDLQDEASEYSLYRLFAETVVDNPAMNTVPNFEEWRRVTSSTSSDCVIIAADEERFVGVTLLTPTKQSGEIYNKYTGVNRAYRGRKLALALKLLSIRTALNHGISSMRTENDSLNLPMLSVNKKLGYVPIPGGHYVVAKTL